jgi:hypothetical protein
VKLYVGDRRELERLGKTILTLGLLLTFVTGLFTLVVGGIVVFFVWLVQSRTP